MRQRTAYAAGIVFCLFVVSAVAAAQPEQPVLVNGGFEGAAVEWSQRVNVAQGWTPVYWDREPMIGGGSPGRSAQPEYKPARREVDPYRVRSGDQSQCWFWFYTHGDAAIYQRVQVPAGYYRLEAWAQMWVSHSDGNPHGSQGEMYVSLGIDPEGRTPGGWPWETSVVWSPFVLSWNRYERFESRVVHVERDGWITVYLRAWKKWDEKHGDVYWDDARLFRVDGPGPVATATPYPTYTPYPTGEPGAGCDYAQIRADVATVVAGREPVRWP